MSNTPAFATPPARHPFRRSFETAQTVRARRRDDTDIRLFALSFAAFFICFYTFIF